MGASKDSEGVIVKNEYGIIDSNNPLRIDESAPLDIRYDADDSQPIYIGLNFLDYNADTSVLTWTVFKYTYSGSSATRIQRRDDIAWDNRGSSF